MLSRLLCQSRGRFSKLLTWGQTTMGWGRSFEGKNVYEPAIVQNAPENIAIVATSRSSIMLLTNENQLHVCGNNKHGSLMVQSQSSSLFYNFATTINQFTKVDTSSFRGKIIDISLSQTHSLVLLQDGRVFTSGKMCIPQAQKAEIVQQNITQIMKFNVLDDVSYKSSSVPILFPNKWFSGVKFVSVRAGEYICCGLSDTGKMYMWGQNTSLFLPQDIDSNLPNEIELVNSYLQRKHLKVLRFQLIDQGLFLLCNDGKMYVMGKNQGGAMGTRKNELVKTDYFNAVLTQVVDVQLEGEKIVDFQCSVNATIVITDAGNVFYTGMFSKFQLTPFPEIKPKTKKIFATYDSVGLIDIHNKIYFLNDKFIQDSDKMKKDGKVYLCEDPILEKVIEIGGTHRLRYALTL